MPGKAFDATDSRLLAYGTRLLLEGMTAAVRESGERVRAAIKNSGLKNPNARLTVNLAPAGVRKSGEGLDLPIAIGILIATGDLKASGTGALALVGELALDNVN